MVINKFAKIFGASGSARRRACNFFVLAFVLSMLGFLALFIGGVFDKFVRVGFALLSFVGFAMALNKAFQYWDKQREAEEREKSLS